MKKLNVLYIWNDSTLGGATQSLLDALSEMKEVVNPIIIMREDVMFADKFIELGVRYYKINFSVDYDEIGKQSEIEREFEKRKSYNAAYQLIPLIKEEKIDLVHINSSTSYFGAIAAIMTDIPYVWHIREILDEHYGCEFVNAKLVSNLLRNADKIIAISDYVRQKYQEKYNVDTVKIYNGLDIKKYKNDLKEKIHFKNVFLIAGNITPEKRQWDAVRATEILINSGYTDVILTIAGNGTKGYIWALKKYISKSNLAKNIHVVPFQKDLDELRRTASYVIACSQNEALGRGTVEAMLAGNLVIGARSGATTELIGEEEERGLLYELGNYNELANKMLRMMQYPETIKNKILANAQAYVEKHFNSKHYCKKILKLYNEVIDVYSPRKENIFENGFEFQYRTIQNDNNIISKITEPEKAIFAFKLAVSWLEVKQRGISLCDYFKNNHIHSVAIYGMADLGRLLYDELEQGNVQIKYLIDKNPNGMDKILNFTVLNNDRLDVDAIVVTVASTEKQLVKELQSKGRWKVIGLSDIINAFQ